MVFLLFNEMFELFWDSHGSVNKLKHAMKHQKCTECAENAMSMNFSLIAQISLQEQISFLPLFWLCSKLEFGDLVHHDKEGNISNGQTWGGEKVLKKGTIWSEQVRKRNLDLNLSWGGRDQHSKAQKRAPRQLGRKLWWLSRSLEVWLKQTERWEDEPAKVGSEEDDTTATPSQIYLFSQPGVTWIERCIMCC